MPVVEYFGIVARISEIETLSGMRVLTIPFALHQILNRFGYFSSSELIIRSLSIAKIVLRGSLTDSGYVMFPPFEPSPRILTVYPASLFSRARFTTLASPTSALKTSAPKAAAISSIRMDVGPFTTTAGL